MKSEIQLLMRAINSSVLLIGTDHHVIRIKIKIDMLVGRNSILIVEFQSSSYTIWSIIPHKQYIEFFPQNQQPVSIINPQKNARWSTFKSFFDFALHF